MKYAIAIGYFLTFSLMFSLYRKYYAREVYYGIASLTLLFCISLINDRQYLIAEKLASFFSYEMFQGDRFQLGFLIQYVFLYPVFSVFNFEYSAHGFNMGLQAFLFLISYKYIFDGKNDARLIYLLYLFFPSYYHYSIFGLRDTLINAVSVFIVISALTLDIRKYIVVLVLLSTICIGIRAEYSLIIIAFIMIRLFLIANSYQRFILVLLGIIIFYFAIMLTPSAFGFQTKGTVGGNIEALMLFNDMRATRHNDADIGGGSQILGGALYQLGFLTRYPIQVVASFVTPLPFEIRGGRDYLAFIESMMFVFVFFMAFLNKKNNTVAVYLFWSGLFYMLLQAAFQANYGNILRIRYPCYIFFVSSWMLGITTHRSKT